MKQKLEILAGRSVVADWILSAAMGVASLRYLGNTVCCPICENTFSHFLPGGRNNDRPGAKCPRCRALERHRAVWYFLTQHENILQNSKQLLFVAPEYGIRRALNKSYGLRYISTDLSDPRAQIKMDVTFLAFADCTFDSLLCMHVLEHVKNDQAAIGEFFRVLAPGGWAVVQVPVNGTQTLEDDSIVTPEQRLKVFGQADHVRQYGEDFPQRLSDVGFRVRVVNVRQILSDSDIHRHGLLAGNGMEDDIYFCVKPR